jgi:hypothetical protein
MRMLLVALALAAMPLSTAAAQAHVLIVGGIGGEQRWTDYFHTWGVSLATAARERFGLPAENVVFLSENPGRDPARISGESRKENIERAFAEMARRAAPDDRIMVVIFGHGSSDSRGSRVNIPGPDLTAAEYAQLLAPFRSQPIAFVNAASASGDFHQALAGPNRTILTATRSGNERNETMFGGFFVDAFAKEGADADRDGRVTIAEAFEYAVRETQRFYQTANRLQLENARLEGDGELAKVFHLGGSIRGLPADAPAEVRELYAERQRLEQRVEALRVRSGQMDPAAYQRELETLLLELARTNRAIQEREGGR